MKYLKPYEKRENKFIQGDYVFLKSDRVNGHPMHDISKTMFLIKDVIGPNKPFNQEYQYLLQYLSNHPFVWVKEDALRPATEKEINFGKIENDAKKYNL